MTATPPNHKQLFMLSVADVARANNLTGPQIRLITRAYDALDDSDSPAFEHFWMSDPEDREAWMLRQLPGQPVPAVLQAMERDFSTESHNGPPEVDDMQAWMDANPGKMWPPEDENLKPWALDAETKDALRALKEAKVILDPAPTRHTKHAYGCFQAAADDEPIFTLRAKDAFAPTIVLQWAALVAQTIIHGDRSTEEMDHLLAKIEDARHCARAMVEWQRNNTLKIPD